MSRTRTPSCAAFVMPSRLVACCCCRGACTPRRTSTGTSAGIGHSIATRLLRAGRPVIGLSRTSGANESLAGGAGSTRFTWCPCDVTDADALGEAVRVGSDRVGPINDVVCAAGIGVFGSVEDTPSDLARRQIDVNYHGAVNTLRAVLPGLRGHAPAHAVLIGSLAARAAIPFQAHYSASK